MAVERYKVRAIKFAVKLSQFLASDQRCMLSRVVLVEYDNFTIDQFCPLIIDGCIQYVQ